jgi:hypothetical protein
MEIGLPNEQGRSQILNIHTSRMKDYKKINPDVDIKVSQNYFILHVGKLQNCNVNSDNPVTTHIIGHLDGNLIKFYKVHR